MARSVEEWTAVLERYTRDLDRLQRDKIAPLTHRLDKFEREWPEIRKVLRQARSNYVAVRLRQRAYARQMARVRSSILGLLKALRYGKALLATDADMEALERALKRRKTRLRVQKLRKKKKAIKAALHDIPVPSELHL